MARFRNSFPKYGDPRRDALARALLYGGQALAQGAGTQGFGALAEAIPAASYGYGEGLNEFYARDEERRKRAREEELRKREDTRWRDYVEKSEQAKTDRERDEALKKAEVEAERERRKSMIEEIRASAGDNAARKAALLSPAKLESEYVKLTGAKEPKPPQIRESGGDWYIFDPEHPDADEVGYRLYKKEPEGERDKEKSSLTPGQLRNEAQEIAERELGSWTQWSRARLADAATQFPQHADPDDPKTIKQGMRSMLGVDEQQLRNLYNRKHQESFDRAMRRLSGEGEETAQPLNPTRVSDLGSRNRGQGSVNPDPAAMAQEAGLPNEVAPLIKAVGELVPPEVAQSKEFQADLAELLRQGKGIDEIIRLLEEAAGR